MRTLRATSSLVSFWAAVVIAVLLVGDAAVRGRWDVVAVATAPVLLGVWAMWMLLWRPGIRLEADRAVVINIGRVHELPWSRVEYATQRMQIVFTLDDESTLTAWGGPFSRRPGARGPRMDERGTVDAVDVIELTRAAAVPSSDPVRHRWDAIPLTVGLVLAAVVVAQLGFLRS
ncbi:hypothetical protein GCM10009739_25330 [Microbacterium ulmi]